MLAYDRSKRLDGLRTIWREEIKAISTEVGPIDPERDADLILIDMLEQFYRRSGTIYNRGEYLRRALGYRRPPVL